MPVPGPIPVQRRRGDNFDARQLPANCAMPAAWADIAACWHLCRPGLFRLRTRDDLHELAMPGDWIVRQLNTDDLVICPALAFTDRWESATPRSAAPSPEDGA